MGMMEYNNDWKAIQQRFLPCKSEHQVLNSLVFAFWIWPWISCPFFFLNVEVATMIIF